MESRIADLKALNTERRREAAETQPPGPNGPLGIADECTTPAPTAGALFNRPNPRDESGNQVFPYVRSRDEFVPFRGQRLWVNSNGYHVQRPDNSDEWQTNRESVPVDGKDWTGVRLASVDKYRIPNTSVVNKVGDFKMFLCCGYRLTAAQWIWWLNLVCLIAHTTMVFVTLYLAYWRWDRSIWDDEHVTVKIYRITQIPTKFMIDNNLTKWTPGWNQTSTEINDGFMLRENGLPVNFATLICLWFGISAFFHLGACIAGAFEG